MTSAFVFAFSFFLFLVVGSILGKDSSDGITYDDLLQTNVSCAYIETCKDLPPSPKRVCDCVSECHEFGTCCIDSPYREDSPRIIECRNMVSTFREYGYFLVSKCPPEVRGDFVWKDLCESEWNGEDDVMRLAPVSSLDTLINYKNYYCFRCHEDSDEFLPWQLRIEGYFMDEVNASEHFSVVYDKEQKQWTATTGDNYVLEDISLDFVAPSGLQAPPELCKYVSVSDCHPSWTDEDTRRKCRAYSAVVYARFNSSVSYRNPHCGFCNFESAFKCEIGATVVLTTPTFFFSYLLDIHREFIHCKHNQLWDPYARKCRRVVCAIPGYVIKGGICTRP